MACRSAAQGPPLLTANEFLFSSCIYNDVAASPIDMSCPFMATDPD
jgi:hypothetical protein